MNYLSYKAGLLVGVIVVSFMCLSCSKNNYLTDGGVHNAKTSYSTYDYLLHHEYRYFDTVLQIVDHFNLKDSVNNAGTFFAPTDFAVNRLMTVLQIQDLDSLYSRVSSKLITQYLFTDKTITLENATVSMKTYPNWADTIAGIKKTALTYGAASSSFTYFVLQYVKINGYPDGDPAAPVDDPVDATLNCQTTGIETSTGTTLHVLSNGVSLSLK